MADYFSDSWKPAAVVGDGRKVVTTAGNRVALDAQPCKSVILTAEADNTGIIVVGGATVVAALATRRGVPLGPSDSISLDVKDLSAIYLDSTVNGDGVTFTYTQ